MFGRNHPAASSRTAAGRFPQASPACLYRWRSTSHTVFPSLGRSPNRSPVRPENPKRLKVLTFSSHVLILDPCAFDPSPAHRDEVSDDATGHLCLASLYRGTIPLTSVAASGTPRAAASARGLPAVSASTAPPCDRSPVLGVAVSSVVRVAKRPGVRSAPHGHYLAAQALSRSL